MESWVWNEAKSCFHAPSYASSSTAIQSLEERKKKHTHSKQQISLRSENEWKWKDKNWDFECQGSKGVIAPSC